MCAKWLDLNSRCLTVDDDDDEKSIKIFTGWKIKCHEIGHIFLSLSSLLIMMMMMVVWHSLHTTNTSNEWNEMIKEQKKTMEKKIA